MVLRRRYLLVTVALPAALAAQVARPGAPSTAPHPPPASPSYRGFAPGGAYREFATRARALTRQGADPMVCNTSRNTAQLMECGVVIRDPTDSASFYLSAYVLEGKVAMISFGDSGGVQLVDRLKADLTARFGRPHAAKNGTWQWNYRGGGGAQTVRFNWRGRGSARWIFITLWDKRVMDGIARYVGRKP